MPEDTTPTPKKSRSLAAQGLAFLIKAALPIATIVVTVFVYTKMMDTGPKANRNPPERHARLVEVSPAMAFTTPIIIEAQGLVEAAKEISLRPQVSGEVVEIDEKLIPGGQFSTGDVLLKIEEQDYIYALAQAKSTLTQAQASLALELGNQAVAQREYEVLGEELSAEDQTLVFREPQLASAKAQVTASKARLDDAQLDLKRTALVAPFDALVTRKNVDRGSLLSPQSDIIQLIGTETYWLELSIPQTDLHWLVPSTDSTQGSSVILRNSSVWGADASRKGYVINFLPTLSQQGRMARILVAVDDPLALRAEHAGQPPLLVGQYLEAEIIGKRVENSISIPREYVHEGNVIWVMNAENKLEVRTLKLVYSGRDHVVATHGVQAGDPIVVNNLSAVSAGMPLRTSKQSPAGPTPKNKKMKGRS